MNIETIEQTIREIAELAVDDPEVAHIKEDRLFSQVLQAIAAGALNAQDLAQAALKVEELDFERHHG